MAAARLPGACAHQSRARARGDARMGGGGEGEGEGEVPTSGHVSCTVPGVGRGGVLTPGPPARAAFAFRPKTPCFELPAGPRGLFPDPALGVPLGGLDQPRPRPPPPATARGRSGPACEPSGKGRGAEARGA